MTPPTEDLLSILDELDESIAFCTSGTFRPVLPGLEVEGIGEIGVPISETVAKALIEQADQAPYGRGEETIVDTDVRRVWQIEPEKLALRNPEWDDLIEALVHKVQKTFAITRDVKSDLYKMLIYEKGSFFAPHRDTEKIEGMFATLVVCLPSYHKGGKLLVTHDGKTEEIDFGGDESKYRIQYVAFYADCEHEIKPVTEGYRVCLVYNLALTKGQQPSAPQPTARIDAVAELLPQFFADPERAKIAIVLKHEYTEAALSFDALKGADRACVQVLQGAAERLGYHNYLALLEFHQSGTPAYGTFPYRDWGANYTNADGEDAEWEDVFDESLILKDWVGKDGNSPGLGQMELVPEEVIADVPFEEFPFKTEISEASGNAGVSMDRWYHQAVMVLWPAERTANIVANEGPRVAVPILADMIAKSKNPETDKECLTLAGLILDNWKSRSSSPYWYGSRGAGSEGSTGAKMIKALTQLADLELARRFCVEILPNNCVQDQAQPLLGLANKLGWEAMAKPLAQFFQQRRPDEYSESMHATLSIFEELCCGTGKMTADRKAACRFMASPLTARLIAWDQKYKSADQWRLQQADRKGVLVSMVRAFSAIDTGDAIFGYLDNAFALPKLYDLHKVLIPATRNLRELAASKEPVDSEVFAKLCEHCIAELEKLTAKAPVEPSDWAQKGATLSSSQFDFSAVQAFLRDPKQQVHRYQKNLQARRILEEQLRKYDVDCRTDKNDKPQALVITKNKATYQRLKAEYEANLKLLEEMRSFVPKTESASKKKTAVKKTTKSRKKNN